MTLEKQRFVIDTSALTSMGDTKKEINENIREIIELIAKAKKANITCYTPPSVWLEMEGILRNKGITPEEVNKLNSWLIQKSPSRAELKVPAEFIYQYIMEIRKRMDKGLREAEKAVTKKDKGEPMEKVIRDLRDSYRSSLRQGIVDSIEDLSVLLLARELNGGIVAKDLGIEDWATKWGIRYIEAEAFPTLIKEYLKSLD